MKRLIIICEGETEQEFCKEVLYNHFQQLGIYIETPLIKKSMGGIVPWSYLKKQISLHLAEGAYVTTLIDFYGIKDHHRFPSWETSKAIQNIMDRMHKLEIAMLNNIESADVLSFIPYIQLHEFEGLLFNDISIFTSNFTSSELNNLRELEDTIASYDNPELINDGPNTAPSKRLLKLIKGYNKIIYGSLLASEIGLERLRSKSTRFNEWITQLERL